MVNSFKFAFGHQSRAGKDTAVEYLNSHYPGKVIRFADPVYKILHSLQMTMQPLSTAKIMEIIINITNTKCKNNTLISDNKTNYMNPWLEAWVESELLPLKNKLGYPGQKVPELLQCIGEGLRRVISPDVWVDVARNRINDELAKNPTANIYCPDLRYPNEMQMLKELNFITVRVNRSNRPLDRDHKHISETALNNAAFDFVINNDTSVENFCEKIQQLIYWCDNEKEVN